MNTAIVLILVSSFIGSFGAVFLKLGAEHMKGGIGRLLSNYWLLVGIVLYLFSSVFYMMGVGQPGAENGHTDDGPEDWAGPHRLVQVTGAHATKLPDENTAPDPRASRRSSPDG